MNEFAHISVVDTKGKPLYFLANKRIPIELDYNALKPFDETGYVDGIANYLARSGIAGRKTVLKAYRKDGFHPINSLLIDSLTSSQQLPIDVIKRTPRSKVLQTLYEHGCPPLFAFHKTAQITEARTGENGQMEGNIVTANPLARGNFWIGLDFNGSAGIGRTSDIHPYIMAFPLLDVFKTEQRYFEKTHDRLSQYQGNDFGVTTLPVNTLTDAQFANITNRMRIYAFDQNRIDRWKKFMSHLK